MKIVYCMDNYENQFFGIKGNDDYVLSLWGIKVGYEYKKGDYIILEEFDNGFLSDDPGWRFLTGLDNEGWKECPVGFLWK